ncbi:MAG TPA: GntR family transcriptional regulator [Salinarimonas sp.]|nr:GntR family transcriptional regulator [Salinarimonas sp.]
MFDPASPFVTTSGSEGLPPGAESMNAVAYKRLRQAVVQLDLKPGHRVTEAELADRYGLGRASVRTALIRLSVVGLVEAQARHGWLVATVTGALVGEIVAARRALEPSLTEVRLSEGLTGKVETLVAMNRALSGQRGQALATARINDRQILALLASRLDRFHCRWLAEVWDHTDRVVNHFHATTHPWQPPDRDGLVHAIVAGDANAVRCEVEAAIAAFEAWVTRAVLRAPVSLSLPAPRVPRPTEARGTQVRQVRASQEAGR